MIKPLDNHVVLKVEKQNQEEKQVGGIYLAGAKEEKPIQQKYLLWDQVEF